MSRILTNSPNVTPFIPPLPSPAGRSPREPPVIPPALQSSPSWGSSSQGQQGPPQTPSHSNYPIYPQSPYHGPGFIPPSMGQHTPGPIPGSYFPPPTQLPPTAPHHHPGYSHDYTGFPTGATATPGGAGWGAPPPHAGPPPAMAPPWATPAAPPAASPWGPSSAPAPYATPWGPPPAQLATPWHGPNYMAFSQPPVQAPHWGGMPGGMHGQGMPPSGPAPGWGAPPPAADPWGAPKHLSDARAHLPLDVVDKFAIGDYGPVLTPFLSRVVRANVEVNPLLQPADDTDRVYLKWNMLFYAGHCQRSDDRATQSWSNGRNQPATWPRVTQIRIVSKNFPWMLTIDASNKAVGVTCGDVIDQIDRQIHLSCGKDEYNSQSRAEKKKLSEAYQHNRSTAHGVPGGTLGEGMRRCDWLYQDTMYGGVCKNDDGVRRLCGEVLPCTFELKCVHRYPMTAEEIRAQEAREREMVRTREKRDSRVSSARNSVRSGNSGRGPEVGSPAASESDDESD